MKNQGKDAGNKLERCTVYDIFFKAQCNGNGNQA